MLRLCVSFRRENSQRYKGSVQFLAALHNDLADLALTLPVYAHRNQQTFRAGAEHQFSNSFFFRVEANALALAGLQNETFEVAKTIKDNFGNFSGDAIAVLFAARTAGDTRIVSRCRHLIRIHAQIFDLIGELADVPDKNRMPLITSRYRLENVLQHRKIANEFTQKRFAEFNYHPESKRAQDFARGEIDVFQRARYALDIVSTFSLDTLEYWTRVLLHVDLELLAVGYRQWQFEREQRRHRILPRRNGNVSDVAHDAGNRVRVYLGKLLRTDPQPVRKCDDFVRIPVRSEKRGLRVAGKIVPANHKLVERAACFGGGRD